MSVRTIRTADPERPAMSPDVVRCCCDFAAGRTPPGGDSELLASLRWLEARLQAWRRVALEAAAPAPRLPCGELARTFARWLERHPQRANEPLEWLLRAALADLPHSGAPH